MTKQQLWAKWAGHTEREVVKGQHTILEQIEHAIDEGLELEVARLTEIYEELSQIAHYVHDPLQYVLKGGKVK